MKLAAYPRRPGNRPRAGGVPEGTRLLLVPVASNRYHPEGRAAGRFDVVLPPSRP